MGISPEFRQDPINPGAIPSRSESATAGAIELSQSLRGIMNDAGLSPNLVAPQRLASEDVPTEEYPPRALQQPRYPDARAVTDRYNARVNGTVFGKVAGALEGFFAPGEKFRHLPDTTEPRYPDAEALTVGHNKDVNAKIGAGMVAAASAAGEFFRGKDESTGKVDPSQRNDDFGAQTITAQYNRDANAKLGEGAVKAATAVGEFFRGKDPDRIHHETGQLGTPKPKEKSELEMNPAERALHILTDGFRLDK